MLKREPDRWIIGWDTSLSQGEVALIAEMPNHVACSGSIVVVDLQNPRLVAHRDEQIAVGRGGEQSGPVGRGGQPVQMTVHVEIVEAVPRPSRIPVLI